MLTAADVSQAKPGIRDYKLGGERGLYLIVTPNGARYWRFNYRFAGKRKTISLGVYPDVGLSDAREARSRPSAGRSR